MCNTFIVGNSDINNKSMTNKQQFEILELANKAEEAFNSYRIICENIHKLIKKYKGEDVNDVLYQPNDGIIVAVESKEEIWIDDKIPIRDFIKE